MTDSEVNEFYDKLVEYYGDSLANFEHYPKIFQFQVNMYKYFAQDKETVNA